MPNVVSDIAGQYDALRRLLKIMPDDEPISIGDMVDRGPQSKEVVDFFMKNGRAIMGNHEHMMVEHHYPIGYYESGLWIQYNGGHATMDSYGWNVPPEVLSWMGKLPRYLTIDRVLVSHAFLNPCFKTIKEACNLGTWAMDIQAERSIIWNRSEPIERPEYDLQIAGHNAHMGLKWFSNTDEQGESYDWAVCLDASKSKKLTGIHLPSWQVFQVPYTA